MKRGFIPALVLFVATPLIAEYLLGSLSFAQINALPVMCLLYGSGAVLIRETARASGRGWPAIVILGTAYALIEEGFATQSLFNPHYLHLRLLDYGWVPALGIGADWTVYVLSLHVIWSVCVPIALVEALFPRHDGHAWLRVVGRSIFGLLLALGIVAVAAFTHKTEAFMASPLQLVMTGVLIAGLIGGTFLVTSRSDAKAPSDSAAPGVWLVGVFTFVAGSLFELARSLQARDVPWWSTVIAMLALELIGVIVLLRWSRRLGWSPRHAFAAGAGGLLVYCWWGYSVEISLHGKDGLIAHTILVLFTLATLAFAAWRVNRITESDDMSSQFGKIQQ